MKILFIKAAKELGVQITSFKSERYDGYQVYFITTNLSWRELDYGYFIGEPDSAKYKMIDEFKSDINSLLNPPNHDTRTNKRNGC